MRIAYPMQITARGDVFEATFAGLPGVSAAGKDLREVRRAAKAALLDALVDLVDAHEDLPAPSHAKRQELVAPPVLLAAKLALHQTMRDQVVSNVALAERMGTVEGTVRRLLDPRHRSHIDSVEAALALLNKRLVLDLRPHSPPR